MAVVAGMKDREESSKMWLRKRDKSLFWTAGTPVPLRPTLMVVDRLQFPSGYCKRLALCHMGIAIVT
jgi:hypothetical protein